MQRNAIWLLAAVLLQTTYSAFAVDPPVVQWTRAFQGIDTAVYCVVGTSDYGFVVSGMVRNATGSLHLADYYVLRLDSLGNTVWQRTYGSPGQNGPCGIRSTRDGGFVIVGGSDSGQVVLLKVDSFGYQQWRYAGPRGSLMDGRQTSDGGYISTFLHRDSVNLLKLDSSGQLLWTKRVPVILDRNWTGLRTTAIQVAGGGYVLCAEELMKTDSAGNLQWQRTYAGVSAIFDVTVAGDGDYVATGIGRTTSEAPLDDICLLKVSPQGGLRWKKAYPVDSIYGSEGLSLVRTSDGGFFIAGETGYGYVLRTDSLGNALWHKSLQAGYSWARSGLQSQDGGYIVTVEHQIVKLAP